MGTWAVSNPEGGGGGGTAWRLMCESTICPPPPPKKKKNGFCNSTTAVSLLSLVHNGTATLGLQTDDWLSLKTNHTSWWAKNGIGCKSSDAEACMLEFEVLCR